MKRPDITDHANVDAEGRSHARRRAWLIVLLAVVCGVLGIAGLNIWMMWSARPRIVHALQYLPANDVALVLGTAPTGASGRWRNPFFVNRMQAAADLFRAGKVRHLLVSGDNRRHDYDEPTAMRDALIALGVPSTAITLDYAGFRTLDSMARAKAVFQLRNITIVSDAFHQPRALFLARAHGLDATGFASRRVPFRWAKKTYLREIASRVKAWLDVYVLHTAPKFYGPVVPIKVTAPTASTAAHR